MTSNSAPTLPVSPLMRPMPHPYAVAGVTMAATSAGIRRKGDIDLMLAEFAAGTEVAGVFTRSCCPGAPVDWCRTQLPHHTARALVVNSGNANVFTGQVGAQACARTAAKAAQICHCNEEDIYLASTGVIGEFLPVERITHALGDLHTQCNAHSWEDAARAIMTTDTFPKLAQKKTSIGNKNVTIQGIAKGSGMIAPDMATMLGFVVTDADLPAPILQAFLKDGIDKSFNCITVDSDTSTSDMVLLFATKQAGNKKKDPKQDPFADPELAPFKEALDDVLKELALLVIRDGEGITKLITVHVSGAVDTPSARRVGLSIANSPLIKATVAGEDPNWGRIVMAVGKSGEPANRDLLSIAIGGHQIAKEGRALKDYDEAPVLEHMKGTQITIGVDLGLGEGRATIWGCDLTHGYVDINGAYRS